MSKELVIEKLIDAVKAYQELYGEPLDGDAVDSFAMIASYCWNFHQGNLTDSELLTLNQSLKKVNPPDDSCVKILSDYIDVLLSIDEQEV